MINREQALDLIRKHVKNENIVKHMLATEALMAGVYDFLAKAGETDLGGSKEEWLMTGLLHDGDYCEEVPMEKQGVQISEWVKGKGFEIPLNVAQSMAAHNWHNTGMEPKTKMDWAIFCGDSLTGLIVAATLVRPDKKLASVEVTSVMKKFKDKAFAKGTRRDDIKLCQEKLNIPLIEFVEICLKAMQNISQELGL